MPDAASSACSAAWDRGRDSLVTLVNSSCPCVCSVSTQTYMYIKIRVYNILAELAAKEYS